MYDDGQSRVVVVVVQCAEVMKEKRVCIEAEQEVKGQCPNESREQKNEGAKDEDGEGRNVCCNRECKRKRREMNCCQNRPRTKIKSANRNSRLSSSHDSGQCSQAQGTSSTEPVRCDPEPRGHHGPTVYPCWPRSTEVDPMQPRATSQSSLPSRASASRCPQPTVTEDLRHPQARSVMMKSIFQVEEVWSTADGVLKALSQERKVAMR